MTTNTSEHKLIKTLIKNQDQKHKFKLIKSILSNIAASSVVAIFFFSVGVMGLKACDAEYEAQLRAAKAHQLGGS